MSNNLALPEILPGMENLETAIATALDKIDAAITDLVAIDLTTADKGLTSANGRKAQLIKITASNTPHVLTLPNIKKFWLIVNTTAFATSIKRGATVIPIPANGSGVYYCTGETDGLLAIGSGGGGSGGGIEEAPEDGKTYGRKNAAWSEVEGGGGGGGKVPLGPKRFYRMEFSRFNGNNGTIGKAGLRTSIGGELLALTMIDYSSQYSAEPASAAINYTNGTPWAMFDRDVNPYLDVDAGSPVNIAEIYLKGRNDGAFNQDTQEFKLYWSPDNTFRNLYFMYQLKAKELSLSQNVTLNIAAPPAYDNS